MRSAPAQSERRVRVRWIGYPEMSRGTDLPTDRRRPDVLVLAVHLAQVAEDDVSQLAGVRDEADVVAAVVYSPRESGPAGTAERAVLRAVRESSDVVVHGSDPELLQDVLSGIGTLEDALESAAR